MKPIELTLQGLHSFREKQVIDFASLCEGGVFGIFGPTGSGKSSILDAMTLSLYGKVERAPSNTQGILNHAEDQLAVSFTFSLGEGRYKVERTFKRVKDDGLRQATARFINITTEAIVVADKAGDVTREVEAMLGLSIDDFTRAVVLPQGKFSEFLSLKGTERRQMLQRLFHLERYGDQLNQKLRQRLTATKHDKELIEKEQLGLGDASNESLEVAKNKVVSLKKGIKKQEEKLDIYQKEYEESKQLMEWIAQLQSVEKELNELDKQQSHFTELKQEIVRAKEANILFPYVQEVEESQQEIHAWEKKEAEANKDVNILHEKAERAKKSFEKASFENQTHEVPLKMKLDRFESLKTKVEDLKHRTTEVSQLQSTIKDLNKTLKGLELEQTEAKETRKKYEEAQQDLKEELKLLQWDSEEKQLLNKANEQKYTLQETERRIKELTTQVTKQQKETDKAVAAIHEVEAQQTTASEALHERFQQMMHWYNIVLEKKQLLQSAIHDIQDQKELQQENQLKVAVQEMRQALTEGEICPVCGSTEHFYEHDTGQVNNEIREDFIRKEVLLKFEAELGNLEKMLGEAGWRLDKEARQSPINPEVAASTETLLDNQVTPLPSVRKAEFTDSLEKWSNQWQKEDEAISRVIQQWEQQNHSWTKLENKWNESNIHVKQAKERLKEIMDELEKAQQTHNTQLTEWKTKFPEHPYSNIDEIVSRMQKNEHDSDKLRIRIEKSVPYIEKIQTQLDNVAGKIQELIVDISKKESELNEKKTIINDMNKDITNETNGENIDTLIEGNKAKLEKLQTTVEKTKSEKEKLEGQVNTSERYLADCSHSKTEAISRNERALQRWTVQKESSSFNDMSLVNEKIKNLETINSWELNVSDYENNLRDVTFSKKQVEDKLQGKHITSDMYEEKKTIFVQAKQEIENMRTAFGAASHYLEEIEKKRERYDHLEEKRIELESLFAQLSKLDKVFRGKEFVEFIAEEQLVQVSRLASEKLRALTRGRYAIEVDSSGGFIMRDDHNGGVKRPVTTLSGGETFLTSLALALSLSASIQLNGEHALEFFFLDEGFGTLDPELLETVITALEQLHTNQLSVGVISHVPELKERLPRKIMVTPAEPGGRGSRTKLESI
ncbi:hypothetical protein CR203_04785 [Salipaludibacillus neizhouensis]|uniref:Nuclease SbcCD subunit C n=1 Tax=Salipaludibacillus neizhouensis TaxID=885475 RepID=A0A3A9KYD4_9BACI|nr:SMC family ATPase [Salipaludibacillus neizhouensis]RKL69346.1 hypothetical protein CR203_04785 [Salipaludibacillus neizhouensis]